jgi:hypothetical protein
VARTRHWLPAFLTLALLGAGVALVQRLPPSDFRPFTLAIEVYQLEPGGSSMVLAWQAELRYESHSSWQLHNPSDEYIYACRDGIYGHYERSGAFVVTTPEYAYPCPGPTRWIGYGIAWAMPWDRAMEDDRITYTNGGERVVFDRNTGLPLLYEAGGQGAAAKERRVYTW